MEDTFLKCFCVLLVVLLLEGSMTIHVENKLRNFTELTGRTEASICPKKNLWLSFSAYFGV